MRHLTSPEKPRLMVSSFIDKATHTYLFVGKLEYITTYKWKINLPSNPPAFEKILKRQLMHDKTYLLVMRRSGFFNTHNQSNH